MERASAPRVAARWLLHGLFGLALVPMALGVARKVKTFERADILMSRNGTGFLVRSVGTSALDTGLRPGDLLLLVDGLEARRLGDPSQILGERAADVTVHRAGQLLRVHTRPCPVPWSERARYLFLVFVGGVFFVAGATSLRRSPDAASESLLFAAFSLSVSLVLVLTPAPPFDGFYRVGVLLEELSRALFPALLLQLVFTFPRRVRGPKAAFFFLPSVFLLAASAKLYLAPEPGIDVARAITRLDNAQALFMCGAALVAATRLLFLTRRTIDLLAEKQIRFLLFGTAVGLLPLCVLDLLPRLLGGSIPILSSLSLLPLALLPLAFLAALTRYRLWDVETLGRETAALLGSVLVGAGFFTLAHMALALPLAATVPFAKETLQTTAGLLMALSFVPVRRSLSSAFWRVQYADSRGDREGLLSLVRELSAPHRLGEIEHLLVSRIAKGLGVAPVSLLFISPDSRLSAACVDSGAPFELAELPEEARVRTMRLSRRGFTANPTPAVARLRRAGFRTLAPLAVSGRLLAICAIGDKGGRVPLSREDQELLETVLAPGALALDHARLYEELNAQAERYRTLKEFHEDVVSGSAAAIAATDEDGHFTSVNSAFGSLLGRAEAELLGQADTLAVPVLAGLPLGGQRIEVDMPPGRRVLDVALSPFPGARPGSRARVYVLHDVTENARLEKALADRERLAALGTLSAGVAHEVNTPLAGVTGFARLLLDEIPVEDPRRTLVEKIERQAFRASRLVGSLLDLARGKPRDLAPVDPAELAREAARALEDEAHGRGVSIELDLPEHAPRIAGHADALIQVLVNLAKNGIEAATSTPNGPARVSLRLSVAGGHALFEVDDNGPGISEEQQSRVFEPFYSTKMAQGGTGLGLAIAGDIIRAHGGTLSVASTPGKGSRFTVTLPVAT